jgi:hypothetical protein
MLNRVVSVALLCLLVIVASAGQTQDSDAQVLRQILGELRAIHEDMRVSETTQLLVAELEMQQAAVNHATEDADNARIKLNEIRQNQKQSAVDLDHAEDQLDKTSNPDERNAFAQDIERQKSHLAELKTAERDWNATLQEMQQRLQNAQDKLANIESELNSAIARLSPVQKDRGRR